MVSVGGRVKIWVMVRVRIKISLRVRVGLGLLFANVSYYSSFTMLFFFVLKLKIL